MHDAPIAIVGLAYRAPGVGRKGLWDFLAEAKSAWSKVPTDRFDQDAFYHPDSNKAGTFSSQGAHFLPGNIYSFDASFFNLRPDEARDADPQHRMLLECAFEAAEDAGISLADIAGANIGVFAAIGSTEYGQQSSEDLFSTTAWTALGGAPCMFANRLSYFFDLNGPSISLDAACASSSYAIHLACQSLRTGECNAAFVGASTLISGPTQWNCLDKLGALSPEGKCFSYDAKASGFGRGEGAACLLVKRLEDAVSSGDPIHAVIRNSACSHSGRSEGITMPSRVIQEKLLLRVHEEVGLRPGETPFVEGHGTGTQAGDPIEAGAFATILASERTASNPLYIGSVKSNLGHLEGASGILGVIKAIMMLQCGCILPNAGFEELNQNIEGREKLRVSPTILPWPPSAPKRVLVTNFGFGGSNAAVLLEEAPTIPRPLNELANDTNPNDTRTNGTESANMALTNRNGVAAHDNISHDLERRLFVLSAKSESSLISYMSSFRKYLETAPESNDFAKDLSFTLGQRRTHHPYRVAVIADSVFSLRDQLSNCKVSKVKDRPIAYAFTGQGAQQRHAQMASGLRRYDAFATAIDLAETHLHEMGASWSLTEELDKPVPESRINDAEVSQPACTAVQLALVVLLKSWGVAPTTVTGHSSGEIAAAFAAGIVSFRAAMAIAYYRGQAATELSREHNKKGAMLALGTGFEVASTLLQQNTGGYATIAAINSPQSVTVSGDESAIENVKRIADAEGMFTHRLKVNVAYHSQHMGQVAGSYLTSIKPFINAESLPIGQDHSQAVFVSSVTGRIEGINTVDASYWVRNLVQPVRFADAIESIFLARDDDINSGRRSAKLPTIIVELGPHSALQNPIKQTVESIRQRGDQRPVQFAYLASLVRGASGVEALLGLAGNLFSMGTSIQLAAINQADHHHAHVLTNLPPYSWDKSVSYLHKSRITQEKLHPGQSFAPLLGSKGLYGIGSEPTFRQVFTLDDIPWIRDHNVAGHVIFPMTGYISMAVEALRRVSPSAPASILIREFHVKRSLYIEEDERVEILTKLRPAITGTETYSSTAWAFEINSWTEANGWMSHSHGHIESEASDMTMESPTFKVSARLIGSDNLKKLDVEHQYNTLGRGGTLYGPTFRSMCNYWGGPSWTVMETELRDLDVLLPWTFGSPISIDPPTLDSHLQGIGPFQGMAAYMPNYVSRLRISNMIPAVDKQRFTIVTRVLGHDTKAGRLRSSIAAFAQCHDSLMPVAEWESVTYRSISSPDSRDSASSLPAGYFWDLIPSLDFGGDEVLAKMVSVDPDELEVARQHRRKVNSAGIYYMDRALKETAGDDFSQQQSHLTRYLNWSRRVVARENQIFDGEPSSLLAEVSNSNAQGQMLCAVGEQLTPILQGKVQALEIMLKDNLLMRNYEDEAATTHGSRALAKFVRHLSHIRPDLHVLEVGAGTASATLPVLEELSRDAEELPAFLSYTFTDISTGFFENARTKLAKWTQRVTYKRLDISQDPVQQGFAAEHYDVVIASNVLHATPNIAATLNHVRTLLKPNGKLLLMEAICHPALSLPFALLPGWWLSEDNYRDHEEGPLLSEETWQRVLSERGFSGVDSAIADYPGSPEHVISVICSTRIGIQEDLHNAVSITICGLITDDEEDEFAQMVSDHVIQRLGCPSSIKPLSEIDATDDPFCIFIDSPRHSVLGNLSSETFETIKDILLKTNGLLWVIPENCPPEAELIRGMLRTLRHESESRNLLLLEDTPSTPEGALAVAQLAGRLRDLELANAAGIRDQDFVWHKGKIHLPRFRQLTGARDVFASEAGIAVRKVQNIWQGDDSLEMTVDIAGSPDSIYFRKNDAKTQPLGDSEVLIRVEAAGVNFRDLLLVLGSIPWTKPGFEGAGVVVQTGSGVADLQPGDRVFYGSLAGGAFGTYVRMASWRVCKIPDGMSSADAASISVAYSTAIFAIMRVGRLRRGESVLIHAASGAVGQACIVLAQHLGARIFATAGTPAKREFLHETFSISREDIFSSRTPEFRDGILCATDSQGVDVVVNSLSGNLLQETWALMGDFGRFVEIGKRDLLQNSNLGMRPFDRNVTFSGVDLRTLFERRPEEERECLADLVDLIRRKVIVPIRPVTTLSISQLAMGLRKLQSGQNVGKIVVTMGPDDSVLADFLPTLDVPSGRLLRPDATYLITGGTGGIGLSLASWMVKNGARSVVLLGRSGSSRPEVRKLLEQYDGTDVRMRAVSCNVGSRPELVHALQSIQDLPQVRGVVHGALFLRGAWNLHELLGDVDFFIALSSFVGAAGNVGQAIYSGTATFFDAFARYRLARGLPAVAIALPVVLDVGYAAYNGLTEALKISLGATLTEADLHTAVKGAIIGPSSGLNRDGKAISFRFTSGDDPNILGWQYYHPLALAERINAKQRSSESDSSGQGHDACLNGLKAANDDDPLISLLEALMDKVSSITMIERDEVEPDAPLSNYSLDSLVSVELRNWIRRETGIELALPKIVGAANLRALTTHILSQRDTKK
ncbi:hypothetical protein OIDMADRAFT_172503 [Oidiodendron maius Zn]|uniref:Uncharacterized protein n=1 Tax=Oidiodendron maius (strain Zn) TaxID=913774 RepID=A0A0C3GWY0_OIDMZ|nr:hypothetical protein OIDMADRAFT_172503 [Oidiodendron maius Zn]